MTKPFQDNTSVVKKSAASKVSQWACRNWCQLVDWPRSGAGSNPLRWRMLSTVESLTLNPRLASAPTMRLLPQVGFSWSSVITSLSSPASTDGRPTGWVLVAPGKAQEQGKRKWKLLERTQWVIKSHPEKVGHHRKRVLRSRSRGRHEA